MSGKNKMTSAGEKHWFFPLSLCFFTGLFVLCFQGALWAQASSRQREATMPVVTTHMAQQQKSTPSSAPRAQAPQKHAASPAKQPASLAEKPTPHIKVPSKISTPVKVTPPPNVAPVKMTPPPNVAPVKMTSPPKAAPVKMTPPPNVAPVKMTSPPNVAPVKMTPPPNVAPVKMTSPPNVAPAKVAPTSKAAPAKVAPTSKAAPAKVAPTSKAAPAKVAPTSKAAPVKVTPTPKAAPAKVAPTSKAAPAKVASPPNVAPVKVTPTPKAAPAKMASPTKKQPRKGRPVQGFSSNPFALETTKLAQSRKKAGQPDKQHVVYTATNATEAPFTLGEEGKVHLSSKVTELPKTRLRPQQKTAFSGGENTLSRMEEEPTPEVSLTYAAGNGTSAKIAVNEQDTSSPLYTSATKDGKINSTGVYLDMDVDDDLQLRVGGEYRAVDDPLGHAASDTSRGATVGLRWTF